MGLLYYIPGFLSLIGALVTIIVSLRQQIPFSDLCIRTSVVLIIFYIIGLFVKKVFLDALKDIEEKERQKELERQQEIEKQKEKERQEELEKQEEAVENQVISDMDK